MRHFILFFLFCAAIFASSPYVPLDHWSYSYLAVLHSKGLLPDLNYSNRPFTRKQITGSLERIDLSGLSAPDREIVAMLRQAFKSPSPPEVLHWSLESGDKLSYYDSASTNYFFRAGATVESPYFSVCARAKSEEEYKTNPAYPWKQDRAMAVILSDTYLKADATHFSFVLGRSTRFWGPFPQRSLILSDNTFPFDHLYSQFRLWGFGLSHMAGELERISGHRRFLSGHRMDFPVWHSLRAGIFESILYAASSDGTGRDYDLRYLNPFGIYFLEQMNNQSLGTDGNSQIGFDAEWMHRKLNLRAQFLIDDLQVDNQDAGDQEPPQVAGIFGVDVFYPSPLFTRERYLTLEVIKIMNRVYNAADPMERYTYYGLGLADSSSDFENVRLLYTFCPLPKIISCAGMNVNRQGEGRILANWGDMSLGNLGFRSENSPTGIVFPKFTVFTENTYRPRWNFGVQVRLGYVFEKNIENIAGQNNDGFLFSVKIDAELAKSLFPIAAK